MDVRKAKSGVTSGTTEDTTGTAKTVSGEKNREHRHVGYCGG